MVITKTMTEEELNEAKPLEKQYKITIGKGLYLLVNPNGNKYFRYKFRLNGIEKLISLGVYPEVSLKKAIEERDKCKKLVKQGLDPVLQRKIEKLKNSEKQNEEYISLITSNILEDV